MPAQRLEGRKKVRGFQGIRLALRVGSADDQKLGVRMQLSRSEIPEPFEREPLQPHGGLVEPHGHNNKERLFAVWVANDAGPKGVSQFQHNMIALNHR